MGSSPRGRGKPPTPTGSSLRPRLIPAWAGKTQLLDTSRPPGRAHPRVGGENARTRGGHACASGSSPRGRGKQPGEELSGRVRGLIPAWAGKTLASSAQTQAHRAHPRVGGENDTGFTAEQVAEGSSPRGRGKPLDRALSGKWQGLIPAWAGKTCARRRAARPTTAHPRVGGEN